MTMMRRLALFLSFALLFTAFSGLTSCKQIQRMLPATEVGEGDAAEGTPEHVILQVIKAGMIKDFEEAWQAFRPWLHSNQLESPASERNWKQFNFQSLHRNVYLYLEDETKAMYKIDYDEELNQHEHTWFLVNKKSDMPTPIVLQRDGKANNEWRVKRMSLGN